MPGYYPVFLDLRGRRCVVVGGGSVAERKVRALLEHDGSITVISPTLSPGLRELAGKGAIQTEEREYRTGDLTEAFLAIAAADEAAVNVAVAAEGRERHALVNVVDDPDNSDFVVPSLVRRGDISVAISTAGKSPALARKLRTILEAGLPDEYASILEVVSDARQELTRRGLRIDGDAWQRCLDIEAMREMVSVGRVEEARQALLDRLLREQSTEVRPASEKRPP
jgi:siroheme synthase-like protein